MIMNPKQLTFVREYRGYSQTELASYIPGLSQSNLSKYEKGIGTLSEEVKQKRLDELMALQQEISAELSHKKIGQTLKVIIDRKEGDYYIGRTEFDSPEVDPEVLIKYDGRKLKEGNFYNVTIEDADDFDLYGRIAE